MAKYGGKTKQATRQHALASKPTRIVDKIRVGATLIDKRGAVLTPVIATSRTRPHGDRTGLKVPQPTMEVVHGSKNGADKTVLPVHTRSASGRIMGARIGPCSACGHTRMISNVTRLCGVSSCLDLRQRRFDKRRAQKRAAKGKAA